MSQETTTIREVLRGGLDDGNREVMRDSIVAALALLDNAASEYLADASGAQGLLGNPHTRYRYIPDPAPRGDDA